MEQMNGIPLTEALGKSYEEILEFYRPGDQKFSGTLTPCWVESREVDYPNLVMKSKDQLVPVTIGASPVRRLSNASDQVIVIVKESETRENEIEFHVQ